MSVFFFKVSVFNQHSFINFTLFSGISLVDEDLDKVLPYFLPSGLRKVYFQKPLDILKNEKLLWENRNFLSGLDANVIAFVHKV